MDTVALTALVRLHGELILAQGRLMSALEKRDLPGICQAKRSCSLLSEQVQAAQQAIMHRVHPARAGSASNSKQVDPTTEAPIHHREKIDPAE